MFAFLFFAVAVVTRHTWAQLGSCPSACSTCSAGSTVVLCNTPGSTTNDLTSVPDLPDDVKSTVEEFELDENAITSLVEEQFAGYVNLKQLHLSDNQIEDIHVNAFSGVPQLEELYMDNNELAILEVGVFSNLTELEELDLSGNKISTISGAIFDGLNNVHLNLDDNVIRSFPNDTFADIDFLTRAYSLNNNPLKCDCNMRWYPDFANDLYEELELSPTALAQYDPGTCQDPPFLADIPVLSLNMSDFICQCEPPCSNGTCNLETGTCECDDGFIGKSCDTECPPNMYGPSCSLTCNCVHESDTCNHVTGMCNCLPGYVGEDCNTTCSEGSYGLDCASTCECQNNATCDFVSGSCSCTAGWFGTLCEMACPEGTFGQDCSSACTCVQGECHHITGNCSCYDGYLGVTCDHDCTGSANCTAVNREPCSLATKEHNCGSCLLGHVGDEGDGNTYCTQCAGAPNCTALNRHPCEIMTNTCGTCFERHLGTAGLSNDPCYDPCINGVVDHDETDVDCGGSLCPTCGSGSVCTQDDDCTAQSACLGIHTHTSMLLYPYDTRNYQTCVNRTAIGESILQKFRESLLANDDPLPDANPNSTLSELENAVKEEISKQFE